MLVTGVIAGTLDITGATIHFLLVGGKDPTRILWYIASAVLGKTSYDGGFVTAFLGLLFHYIIATIWTYIFYRAYPLVLFLRKNWWISGIGYGAVVWAGMNLVVVPLSRIPPVELKLDRAAVALLVLVICIGLPISFFAKKYYSR